MKDKHLLIWIYNLCLLAYANACGYPGSPAHASVAFSSEVITPGTVASYTCDGGFELLGPSRRICNENGTWVPLGIPFCVLNVAAGKAPMQSSIMGKGVPQKAVDGSTSTFFNAETCTMTETERTPWWYVNLLEPYMVQLVRVDFGTSCCSNNRPATIVIRVGNNRPDLGVNPICNRYTGYIEEGRPLFLPCNTAMPGAFVSIHLEGPPGNPLSICETFVYTDQALPIERCPSFRDQPLGSTATYNGKCYIFYNNQPRNFEHSRRFCEIRGGSLIDETSPALQGFLSWELYRRHRNDPSGQYWMGAVRDLRDRNNWKWINGQDVTISFWNLPGTNENCSRFDGAKGWLWSDTNCNLNLNFICQHRPATCGKPERPANSTILARSLEIESVIEYRCAPGHLLVGPNIRTCLPTGFFSELPPKCRYLECGLPAKIPNGQYTLVNGTRHYLSSVQYACQDGYVLVGRGNLICDVDEKWNGPPPRCEPVYCRVPPSTQNGRFVLSTNSSVYGTIAEYYCEPGYRLVGKPRLTCVASGYWDADAPLCEADLSTTTSSTKQPSPVYPIRNTHAQPSPTHRLTQRPVHSTEPIIIIAETTSSRRPTTRYTTTRRTTHRTTTTTTTSTPYTHIWTRHRYTTPTLPPLRDIVTLKPLSNDIPDNLNIRGDTGPKAELPSNTIGQKYEDKSDPASARLNMGGIIALAVFGGFILIGITVTLILVFVRRSRNSISRGSLDNTTISTYDSGGSGGHSLHKYYKRAWENLRYDGKTSSYPVHVEHHENSHAPVSRQDTLDNPNIRGNGRGTIEGYREANEIMVSDVAALYARPDKNKPHRPSADPSPSRDKKMIRDWYSHQLGSQSRRGAY
ncbi:uncharacterized protein LOC111628502 [Centruroides sculpturatus]|uniref:uncharacterized protein LOC111628502 n=1 Tax=Centruroides sculpturatus TaxID=218467 RepID=UPI000C6E65DE|nr:uncharacterized protein LOC111628502 [Centruroides sculpturatus]